jgi:hypothetical protein
MNLLTESSIGGTNGIKALGKLRNGEQQAFSFWLYLPNYKITANAVTPQHKLLWKTSGSAAVTAATTSDVPLTSQPGSPIVFLDGRTNRMYISFRTTDASGVEPALGDLIPVSYNEVLMQGYITSVIEYVPLQRWINVVICMQDNVSTVYLDGDVYSVKSVSDKRFLPTPRNGVIQVRPTFQLFPDVNAKGQVQGSTPGTTSGYFSAFHHYNYLLAQKQVQEIYRAGPHASSGTGWISWLTFGNWRLRNPFERTPDGDQEIQQNWDGVN